MEAEIQAWLDAILGPVGDDAGAQSLLDDRNQPTPGRISPRHGDRLFVFDSTRRAALSFTSWDFLP